MTQNEMIVRYLEENGRLTAWEAMKEMGIMRLASRIHEIRKSGIPIDGKMLKSKNRFGKDIRYMVYTKAG